MNSLTPEQDRTLKMYFQNARAYAGAIPLHAVELDHITITNSQIFVLGDVNRKTLPREQHWMWHQSKSKTTIPIQDGEVILTKLNPRRVKGYTTLPCPSYKLWICQIIDSRSRGELNFLWCEKGKMNQWANPPLVKTPKPSKTQDIMDVGDLAFLKEFVPMNVACELGWINPPPNNPIYFI